MRLANFVEQIYDAKLLAIEEKKTKEDDLNYLRASMAGRCFLQHIYRKRAYQRDKSMQSRRLLRLGTIVGDDIEDAIKNHDAIKQLGEVETQEEIFIEELNVKGHLDVRVLHKDGTLEILDFKTVKSWNWKYIFGKDSKANVGYSMQLVTYAIGIQQKFPDKEITEIVLYDDYYRKGDSFIKLKPVSYESFRDATIQYWEETNDMVNRAEQGESFQPGDTYGCPMASFECGYCDFSHSCPSPFKK